MDSIRNALTAIKRLFDWLPDPVVAAVMLALAIAIALSLHRVVRKLIRQLLAERHPFAFSIFSRMRGVTQFALLIFAMVIAVPVAPLDPSSAEWLARLLLIGVIGLIGWAADLPFGTVWTGALPAWGVVVLYAGLALPLIAPTLLRRLIRSDVTPWAPLVAPAAALAVVGLLLAGSGRGGEDGTLRARFFDVGGEGLSLVETPAGQRILAGSAASAQAADPIDR